MLALFEAILVSNMVNICLLRLFWFQQMLTLFMALLVSKSANVVWSYSGFKHANCWWGYSSFNTSVCLDLWSGVCSVCGQICLDSFPFVTPLATISLICVVCVGFYSIIVERQHVAEFLKVGLQLKDTINMFWNMLPFCRGYWLDNKVTFCEALLVSKKLIVCWGGFGFKYDFKRKLFSLWVFVWFEHMLTFFLRLFWFHKRLTSVSDDSCFKTC